MYAMLTYANKGGAAVAVTVEAMATSGSVAVRRGPRTSVTISR